MEQEFGSRIGFVGIDVLAECDDDVPRGMHDSWKTLRSRIIKYLERTSIGDVAEALGEKRRVLEKPRRGRRSAGKSKRKRR